MWDYCPFCPFIILPAFLPILGSFCRSKVEAQGVLPGDELRAVNGFAVKSLEEEQLAMELRKRSDPGAQLGGRGWVEFGLTHSRNSWECHAIPTDELTNQWFNPWFGEFTKSGVVTDQKNGLISSTQNGDWSKKKKQGTFHGISDLWLSWCK